MATFEDSFLADFEELSINEACNVQEDLDQRLSEAGEAEPNNMSGGLIIGQSHVSTTTSESLNSQNPTVTTCRYPRIRMQQQWLLFLRHARNCRAPCPDRNCVIVQELWKHMDNCAAPQCLYPRCRNSKTLLNHFRYCKESNCPVCIGVKAYFFQQQAKNIN